MGVGSSVSAESQRVRPTHVLSPVLFVYMDTLTILGFLKLLAKPCVDFGSLLDRFVVIVSTKLTPRSTACCFLLAAALSSS